MQTASVLRARLQAHRLELRKSPDIADWARNRLDHAVKVMATYPSIVDQLEKLLVKAERQEVIVKQLEQAERAHKAAQIALATAQQKAQVSA